MLRGHAVERRGGGLAHVAALAGVERGVERAVVAEVEPRLAGARVAARGGAQRGLRGQRARDAAVARHEVAADRAGAVVAAVVAELRVEQHVQAVGLAGERLERHVDEHGRPRRVGRVRLGQPPAPGAVGHRLAVVEAVQPLDHADAVHRLAIDAHRRPGPADRELHVADARRPEVGVVDLGHLAVAEREPGPARARRRGAEGVLVGLRPRRLAARRLGGGGARAGGRARRAGGDAITSMGTRRMSGWLPRSVWPHAAPHASRRRRRAQLPRPADRRARAPRGRRAGGRAARPRPPRLPPALVVMARRHSSAGRASSACCAPTCAASAGRAGRPTETSSRSAWPTTRSRCSTRSASSACGWSATTGAPMRRSSPR